MTKTYYIYHVPGEKIGCTVNIKARLSRQGYTSCEILEEHTDIYLASDRELELQKQYGYSRDNTLPYYKTVSMPTFESCSKGGKIIGNHNAETGHLDRIRKLRKPNSPEHQFKFSSAGGKAKKGITHSYSAKKNLSIAKCTTTIEFDNMVREEYSTGSFSQADLCRKYNLSKNVIFRIVKAKYV